MLEFLLIISLSTIVYFFGCIHITNQYLMREGVNYSPFKLARLVYFKIMPVRHALLFNLYLVCVVTCLDSDPKMPSPTIKLITKRAMAHYYNL